MPECRISIAGAAVEPHALAPTLRFTLRVGAHGADAVHAVALRCRIHIEPERRRYSEREAARLADVFGLRAQWRETVRPFFWTETAVLVPAFRDGVDVALPVACTCDLQVAAGQYFTALEDDDVPLAFMFSGSIFYAASAGGPMNVAPVSWDTEARYRLSVGLWRDLMSRYFPEGAWIRLEQRSVDALRAFQSRHALPSFDAALTSLVEQALQGERV